MHNILKYSAWYLKLYLFGLNVLMEAKNQMNKLSGTVEVQSSKLFPWHLWDHITLL